MTDNVPAIAQSLTPEQLELVRSTVAKGATNDELKLFLYQCTRLGLDPLSKQVHFVKYGNNPGTIITGLDGFRVAAHRTGKLSGIKRGAMRDSAGKLIGGWAEVYRTDWEHPAREEVPLKEYFKAGSNGKQSNWDKMPETMIKKVAECAALRMAFPNDLSGIYGKEEMEEEEAPREQEKKSENYQDKTSSPQSSNTTTSTTSPSQTTSNAGPSSISSTTVIDETQLRRLWATANDCGWSESQVRSEAKRILKIESLKLIQVKDFVPFIEHMKKYPSTDPLMILKSNVRSECERLNWTKEHLEEHTKLFFDKLPRYLNEAELIETLDYMKKQP